MLPALQSRAVPVNVINRLIILTGHRRSTARINTVGSGRSRQGGKMHSRIRSMICAAVAASVFYGGSSGAQEVLTEIVVTAQKREQNLQDVPVAVDAFSGAALQA